MKVESYHIKNWEEPETGLLISENKDWILIKSIPVDYAIDGYKLLKKEFVEGREREDEELRIEKVLNLKNVLANSPSDFQFGTTIELLKWVENKFDLFEFQDDDEEESYYGKIKSCVNNKLILDLILEDGEMDPDCEYEQGIEAIQVISFESDYHRSMRLLSENY